ncbi:MAG: hypothetical protein JWP68_252 [Modestobacter sp.]|nr:hypothetical protein [Modestobacter sp.]
MLLVPFSARLGCTRFGSPKMVGAVAVAVAAVEKAIEIGAVAPAAQSVVPTVSPAGAAGASMTRDRR